MPSTDVIDVLEPGGHETVVIAKVNLPAERLAVDIPIIGQGSVGSPPVVGSEYGSTPVAGQGQAVDSTSDTTLSGRYKTRGQTDVMGSATPVNILPPYMGVYFAKRTARKFWVPS